MLQSVFVDKPRDILNEALRLRRALHQIPEAGFCEKETSAFIWQELEKTQPDELKHICVTGIRAVYYAKDAIETIAFRADMDALPMEEKTGLEFQSRHPGFMHACGHDGHMTSLLLLAQRIMEERETISKNIVLIFQPSEEVGCGAEKLINAGVLKNPKVDSIYACHLWPGYPLGSFATRAGVLMAQSCYPDVDIYGAKAHGADPCKGIDAIVAAAGFLNALQSVVSRSVSPKESVVITFGRIMGGDARNVIADHVRLEGTVRVFSDSSYQQTMRRIEEIVRGTESTYKVRIDMNPNEHYPCVQNDARLVNQLRQLLGEGLIEAQSVPNAEDFAFYQQKVPGVMLFMGIDDNVHFTKLHSQTFNFDEAVLPLITDLYWRIIHIEMEETR